MLVVDYHLSFGCSPLPGDIGKARRETTPLPTQDCRAVGCGIAQEAIGNLCGSRCSLFDGRVQRIPCRVSLQRPRRASTIFSRCSIWRSRLVATRLTILSAMQLPDCRDFWRPFDAMLNVNRNWPLARPVSRGPRVFLGLRAANAGISVNRWPRRSHHSRFPQKQFLTNWAFVRTPHLRQSALAAGRAKPQFRCRRSA